jgi:hypothetical protein
MVLGDKNLALPGKKLMPASLKASMVFSGT